MLGGKKKLKLETGLLVFKIGQDEGFLEWEIDLIELKMTIEELEKRHGLTPNEDDKFIATTEFIEDLRTSLSSLGCPVSSSSMARQIWVTTTDAFLKHEDGFKRRLAKFLR
jgi:hypothetical protein